MSLFGGGRLYFGNLFFFARIWNGCSGNAGREEYVPDSGGFKFSSQSARACVAATTAIHYDITSNTASILQSPQACIVAVTECCLRRRHWSVQSTTQHISTPFSPFIKDFAALDSIIPSLRIVNRIDRTGM